MYFQRQKPMYQLIPSEEKGVYIKESVKEIPIVNKIDKIPRSSYLKWVKPTRDIKQSIK